MKHHGAPLAVRRQLLQAVVDGLKTRMPQGSRLELRQDFSSRRALDSVQAARACFPTARLLFVVGVDLLPQIPDWHRASELCALLRSGRGSTAQLAPPGAGHGPASDRWRPA